MRRKKVTGQKKKDARGRRAVPAPVRLCLCAIALCFLLFAAGCAGENRVTDDPLTGGTAPQAPLPSGLPSAGAPVPPLPTSSSALSTASLAGGTPLEGGRPLQIEEPRDKLVNRTTWQQAGAEAERVARGAVLKNPEPILPTGARKDMDPVHGLAASEGAPSDFSRAQGTEESYDQLMARLKQRGMIDFSLDKLGDGVRLTCAVPKKNEPGKNRSYEASAATASEAVKAILAKIDADQ